MTARYAVVSLFSGAGGMSLGFAQAGIKPSLAADIDFDACASYRANLNIDAVQTDLANAEPGFLRQLRDFEGAFALIGGPPCQGFSSAGKKSARDARNRLIFEYLDIVATVRPRWFLFENVEGILTSNGGKSIRDLIREFINLGYNVRLEKVNFAAFGLPQGRKRIIVVGNRLGLDFRFPQPTHSFDAGKHRKVSALPLAPSLVDALAGLGDTAPNWEVLTTYVSMEPLTNYDRLMRDGNEAKKFAHHMASVPDQIAEAVVRLNPGQTMKDLPQEYWHESFARRAFRRVMDGTPTEKRGGAPSGIKRLQGHLNALTITSAATREFIHPTADRPLTVRECARLQSFPDRFRFEGRVGSAIQQIGNAFPPLDAKVFAEHLMQVEGSCGADIRSQPVSHPRLIGYRLTDAMGMSPALATTDSLLQTLSHKQHAMQFDTALAEVEAA